MEILPANLYTHKNPHAKTCPLRTILQVIGSFGNINQNTPQIASGFGKGKKFTGYMHYFFLPFNN